MPDAKTGISYDAYLKLMGLAKLLDDNLAEQLRLKHAVGSLVGEKPDEHGYYGHVDDWVYGFGPHEAGVLLSNLDLAVEPLADEGTQSDDADA